MEVTCENRLVDSASGTLTANSLFAEVRGGDTAVVTYARHLQNLDTASRLPDSITRAVQEQDIQFVNETPTTAGTVCTAPARSRPSPTAA